ncbi:MAG: dUTP diphosphatase, partial [Ruminococcus sp.]|nr:dUTP diphosphatase [Ruminococcus sp.]
QLVITPILTPEICEVDELSDTVRGEGGFGSTGKR